MKIMLEFDATPVEAIAITKLNTMWDCLDNEDKGFVIVDFVEGLATLFELMGMDEGGQPTGYWTDWAREVDDPTAFLSYLRRIVQTIEQAIVEER